MNDDLIRILSERSGRDLSALATEEPDTAHGWVYASEEDTLAARWTAWQLRLKNRAKGEFDPALLPSIDPRVATWADWQVEYFLKRDRNPGVRNEHPALYMYGGLGAGKTSQGFNAIIRIGNELARNNLRFRWDVVTHRQFAAETRDWTDNKAQSAIADYMDVDLLMLDDLGAFNPTPFAADCTSRLIDHRYSKGMVTIYNSNLLFERTPEMLAKQQQVGIVIPVLTDSLDKRDVSRIKSAQKINLGTTDHRAAQGGVIA